jgi:hypothetical protein
LPATQRWLATLARAPLAPSDPRVRERAQLLARAGDLLARMRRAQAGCAQLEIRSGSGERIQAAGAASGPAVGGPPRAGPSAPALAGRAGGGGAGDYGRCT